MPSLQHAAEHYDGRSQDGGTAAAARVTGNVRLHALELRATDTQRRAENTATFRLSDRLPRHVVVQCSDVPDSVLAGLEACLSPVAGTRRLPPGAQHRDAFRLHDVSPSAADY